MAAQACIVLSAGNATIMRRSAGSRPAALMQATYGGMTIARQPRLTACVRAAAGGGSDAVGSAVGGWIDLASFVSSGGSLGARTPFDDLADRIGRDVYIDVAGWHLYLKDVRLSSANGSGTSSLTLAQGLAAQLGAELQAQRGRFDPGHLQALLKKVPVRLGGGKATLALADVVPAGAVRELEDICERYARDL